MLDLYNKVINQEHLATEEARQLMVSILDGDFDDIKLSALLTSLKILGESSQEISGFVAGMLHCAQPIFCKAEVFDNSGTGGDQANTFNISTAVACVISAAGVSVAKAGNRAVSGLVGSADILEHLGVNLDLTPESTAYAIDNLGFAFLFARKYHPKMSNVTNVRSLLKFRTVFNILGPLTNPTRPTTQLMGVYAAQLLPKIGEVMCHLDRRAAMIVYGDGLDELTLSGTNQICEVRDRKTRLYSLCPEDVGLRRWPLDVMRGGDLIQNSDILFAVLSGRGQQAHRDLVALNAGAGLYVAGKTTTLREGIGVAQSVLHSEAAWKTLQAYALYSQERKL